MQDLEMEDWVGWQPASLILWLRSVYRLLAMAFGMITGFLIRILKMGGKSKSLICGSNMAIHGVLFVQIESIRSSFTEKLRLKRMTTGACITTGLIPMT